MKQFISFVGILSLVGAFTTISGCGEPTAAETTAATPTTSEKSLDRVTAGKPERKTLKFYTSQPGRIEAFEEAPIYPKVAGYVSEIKVDIGDQVKKDDVLIKLWIPEMKDKLREKQAFVIQAEAEVKQAEAAVDVSRAAVNTARARVSQAEAGVLRAEGEYQRWKSEYERTKELVARGSQTQKLVEETLNQFRASEAAREEVAAHIRSTKASLSESVANVKKADADLVSAQARVHVANAESAHTQTMLDYAEIKAPFDGIITRRNIDTGHYVHPTTGDTTKPLLVVAQTNKVRIFVDIPELEAPLVNGGENADSAVVRIQSLGGREFNAKVTRTSWSLYASNRSLRTEIDIDNKDGSLRPGMYVTTDILLDQRNDVLSLPASAIVRNGRDTYCCVVESGKIKHTPVKLGLRSGSDVEVLKGLEEGQTVVIARADSLTNGHPVEVIQSK